MLRVPSTRRARGLLFLLPAQQQRMDLALARLSAILGEVRREWRILLELLPLELAIGLLDDTLVGMADRAGEFEETRRGVDAALRAAVTEHYDAFNLLIGLFLTLLELVSTSEGHTQELERLLALSGEQTSQGLDMLTELDLQAKRTGEVVDTLEAVEQVVVAHADLDAALASRDFLGARSAVDTVRLLADAHLLWELPALEQTRQAVETQEGSLFDAIVEEIHLVVYRVEEPSGRSSDLATDIAALNAEMHGFLGALTIGTDPPPLLPQGSAFAYVAALLHLLGRMNRLDQCVRVLQTRCQKEFSRSLSAIELDARLRHAAALKTLEGLDRMALSGHDVQLLVREMAAGVVLDLFTRVFAHALHVLQMHRVAMECTRAIAQLPGFACESSYGFGDVWLAVEKLLELLLRAYIDKDHELHQDDATTKPIGDDLFQFEGAVAELGAVADLQSQFTSLFPGLGDGVSLATPYITADWYVHQLTLVAPSVFHMRLVVDRFVVFCGAAAEVVTQETAAVLARALHTQQLPTHFMHAFMEQTFAPLFELLLLEEHSEAGSHAEHAREFQTHVYRLCDLFGTAVAYRERYSRIVIKVIELAAERYQAVADSILPLRPVLIGDKRDSVNKRGSSGLMAGGQLTQWFHNEALRTTSMRLAQLGANAPDAEELVARELGLMVQGGVEVFNVLPHELLGGSVLEQACELLQTVQGILGWLAKMPRVQEAGAESELLEQFRDLWVFYDDTPLQKHTLCLVPSENVYFEECIDLFQEIADSIVLSLRYDIRLKAVYYIGRLYKEGDWTPTAERKEGDPAVQLLNHEFITTGRMLRAVNAGVVATGIIHGFVGFIDRLFVLGLESVTTLNSAGVGLLMHNMVVIQQLLRAESPHPANATFTRCQEYFRLFGLGDEGIISAVKNKEVDFPYRETKNLLRLVHSVEMASARLGGYGTSPATQAYTEACKQLGAAYGERK